MYKGETANTRESVGALGLLKSAVAVVWRDCSVLERRRGFVASSGNMENIVSWNAIRVVEKERIKRKVLLACYTTVERKTEALEDSESSSSRKLREKSTLHNMHMES